MAIFIISYKFYCQEEKAFFFSAHRTINQLASYLRTFKYLFENEKNLKLK